MNKRLVAVMILCFGLGAGNCHADASNEAIAARIEQQLKSAGRDQYDAAKDEGRKPVEVVQFVATSRSRTRFGIPARRVASVRMGHRSSLRSSPPLITRRRLRRTNAVKGFLRTSFPLSAKL